MSKPSGGGTAQTTLETYQKNTHLALLGGGIDTSNVTSESTLDDIGVIDYLNDALAGGNPYSTAFAYDPEDDLEDIQDAVDTFRSYVTALVPETDYITYITAGLSEVDTNFVPTTHINDEVDAFETASADQFARSVNRFTSGMSDINAVNSSAFIIGMAQMERGREAQLNDYRAKLGTQKEGIRASLAAQFADQMVRMFSMRLEAERAAAQMQEVASKSNIIANKEYLAEDLELDYKDVTFDLDLFKHGGNILASGFGAAQHQVGPSKASSQLSAAISTGGTLASLASPLGPGAAILAGLGGAGAAWLANA